MRTQDAKYIHINEYLTRIGAKFFRTQMGTHGMEYVYQSPARDDKNPSLCVNLDRNIWSDVPAGEGGRLIELVCYLNNVPGTDVSLALSILDRLFPEYRGSGNTSNHHTTPNHVVQSILGVQNSRIGEFGEATSLKEKRNLNVLKQERELYHFALKDYLTKERKIPLEIGKHYLREIHYTREGKDYFALGFKSGKTYALRNKFFKGFLGEGADISIFEKQTSEAYIFEGFFDFLSYLAMTKQRVLPHTAIILNSTAFTKRLIRLLESRSQISRVHCYLDTDSSGQRAIKTMREALLFTEIEDHSETYGSFNDFNEWWMSQ